MNVFACMPKKTHCWKREENVSETAQYSTAIRSSSLPVPSFPPLIWPGRCPCLKCTIKIIQTGVREVVYNLSYKMLVVLCRLLWPYLTVTRDDSSAALFHEAGVILRRHAPLA